MINLKRRQRESPKNALNQIEERKYEVEVRKRGYQNILKIGVVFDGKRVWVKRSEDVRSPILWVCSNAIIAGVLVSIVSGIIGSLIVVNRMVFLAGGIAHTSYGGIGMAIYFGIPIFLGASIFAMGSAFIIAFITLKHRYRMDTFIGLMWAIGMAIGVIFVDLPLDIVLI